MTRKVSSFFFAMSCCLLLTALLAGSAMSQAVRLRSPTNRATSPLTVMFQWEVKKANPRIAYCAEIVTDKGQNPWDGSYEEVFEAGQASELQVQLPYDRYQNERIEWGVRVKTCKGKGRYFYSPIRVLHLTASLSDAPAAPEPSKPLVNPTLTEPAATPEPPVEPISHAALDRLQGEWEMTAEYTTAVNAGASRAGFSFSVSTMRITGKHTLQRLEPGTVTFQLGSANHVVTLRYDAKTKKHLLTAKADDYVQAADLPTDFPLTYSEPEGFTASLPIATETAAKFTPKITFMEDGGHRWHIAPEYKLTFRR